MSSKLQPSPSWVVVYSLRCVQRSVGKVRPTNMSSDDNEANPALDVDDTELAGMIAWAWMEADGYPFYGDLERDALDQRARIAVRVMRSAMGGHR